VEPHQRGGEQGDDADQGEGTGLGDCRDGDRAAHERHIVGEPIERGDCREVSVYSSKTIAKVISMFPDTNNQFPERGNDEILMLRL
jgi:hypothetical protein